MTVEKFFTNFGHLADAPNGVQKLRELILQLAVRGKLVPQDASDEPASVLLEMIKAEKIRLTAAKEIRNKKISSNDKAPYELPKSWSWVPIGNICRDWGQKKPDQRFNYIDVSAIDNKKGIIAKPVFTEAEKAPSRARKLVKLGTVIYSTVRPYLLNIAVIDKEISPTPIASTAFAIVHPLGGIPSQYIFWFLRSSVFVSYVESKMLGVAYPAINDNQFFSGLLPLPPLNEQKRIVAKVDQLMTLCDELGTRQKKQQQLRVRLNNAALDELLTARKPDEFANHWQRICTNFDLLYNHPEAITKLRAAILQLAVQGKLVGQITGGISITETLKGARQAKVALENGKKTKATKMLPQLDEAEMPHTLPPSWSWVRLNDIILLKHGFAFKSTFFTQEQTPYVLTTPGNFFERGGFRDRGERTKFYRGEIDDEFILNPGDLIIPMTEQAPGLLGSPAFIPNDERVYLHNQRLAKITLLSQSISPEFVACFFNSTFFRRSLAETCSGTTVRHTSPQKILKVPFPLPPFAEQKRIVAKVDQLMTLCDQLEEKLNRSQQKSEKLVTATVQQLLVA